MKNDANLIFNTGIDIVHVRRMSLIVNRWGDRFLNRVWSAQEIDYCRSKQNPSEHLAGRFACKEAVSKALGLTRSQGIRWKEINIINNHLGAPEVRLSGETRVMADKLKISTIFLSLSHCRDYAVASAIIMRDISPHREDSLMSV